MKYHGLKDKKCRIPYHDSISVCANRLFTKATVEFHQRYRSDIIEINGSAAAEHERHRILSAVKPLLTLAHSNTHFKLSTLNNLTEGKGLGFSASAFAAIFLATSTALNLKMKREYLSEFARLGAASASRSLMGGFSILFANRGGRSYAKQLPSPAKEKLGMCVIPIGSKVKTDEAHEETAKSPFFKSRLETVKRSLVRMRAAIRKGDLSQIGELAEEDSLNLHATTMTGPGKLILMAPETIRVIKLVQELRELEGIPLWYSLDTGPSVFINTSTELIGPVARKISRSLKVKVIPSRVGGPANLLTKHLF